jgi:dienelactone hydrolase
MQQCVPSKFDYIKWCLSKTECADNYESVGLKFRNLLGEVSSWGALAIATGPAFVDPVGYEEPPVDLASVDSKLNPNALTEAIDWVYENAGKGDWKHIDRSRIGVWGQSCGGLEAYLAGGQDDRVGHLGIFNSGQLTVNASEAIVGKITKPIFYILGGPTDMAYVSVGTPSFSLDSESTISYFLYSGNFIDMSLG